MARVISLRQVAANLESRGVILGIGDYLQLKDSSTMFYDKDSGFSLTGVQIKRAPMKIGQKLAAGIMSGRFNIISKEDYKKGTGAAK